jgi:hypothetical protein
LPKRLTGSGIITESRQTLIRETRGFVSGLFLPKKAANNVLQQPSRLLLHELRDHVAEHRANSVETLISSADVVESMIIEEDLLDNEDGNRLAEL